MFFSRMNEAAHQQCAAVDPLERLGAQVRQHEVGFAGVGLGGGRLGRSVRRRLRKGSRRKGQRQHQRGEEEQGAELSGHCHPFA
jgi:hypothetical protein